MSFNLFYENTLKQTINWLRRNYITIYKERDKKKNSNCQNNWVNIFWGRTYLFGYLYESWFYNLNQKQLIAYVLLIMPYCMHNVAAHLMFLTTTSFIHSVGVFGGGRDCKVETKQKGFLPSCHAPLALKGVTCLGLSVNGQR